MRNPNKRPDYRGPAVAMSTIVSNREFLKALGLAVAALAASAALLVGGYLLLAPVLHPEFKSHLENDKAAPIAISGNRFRPVVFGDGGFEGSAAVISALAEAPPEDHAVLVHKRVFEANRFAFFRYHIEGRNPALRVMLFWQRADTPGENHFAELDYSGDGPQLHNLLRSEEWRGTITELAVGFFGDLRGEPVKLHRVGLEPYNSGRLLEAVGGEWMALALWNQASIHHNRGAPKSALIHPTPAAALWVASGTILLGLFLLLARQKYNHWQSVFLLIVLTGWLALDSHWLKQLLTQNVETRHLFAGKTLHEKKLADWDGDYYGVAHALKTTLAESNRDIVIFYEDDVAPFSQRLRFHMLPDINAEVVHRPTESRLHRASREFDHVVLLVAPGDTPLESTAFQEALDSPNAENWQLVWNQGPAALYATNRSTDISK